MPTYVILDVEVTDPETFARYAARSGDTVAAYGGRYLVRGGEFRVLEGDPNPHRVVVTEFPDDEAARAWYESPEYQEILPLRLQSTNSTAITVQGVQA
jgi:uncharacterized protein (DUF1330 family)